MKKLFIFCASVATAMAVFFTAHANSSILKITEARTISATPEELVEMTKTELLPSEDIAQPELPQQLPIQPVAPVTPTVPVAAILVPSATQNTQSTQSIQKPAAQYAYQLTIPKIGMNAPVLGMGLTPDGKMAVPNNFTEVGWYNLGAKPGSVGNAVMGAHVDNGGRVPGVFKNLKNLAVGDDIYTTDQNGTRLHFRVAEIKIYDYKETNTDEVFGTTSKTRLNLITCHGTFLPKENTYNQRLIVFAELVN